MANGHPVNCSIRVRTDEQSDGRIRRSASIVAIGLALAIAASLASLIGVAIGLPAIAMIGSMTTFDDVPRFLLYLDEGFNNPNHAAQRYS